MKTKNLKYLFRRRYKYPIGEFLSPSEANKRLKLYQPFLQKNDVIVYGGTPPDYIETYLYAGRDTIKAVKVWERLTGQRNVSTEHKKKRKAIEEYVLEAALKLSEKIDADILEDFKKRSHF